METQSQPGPRVIDGATLIAKDEHSPIVQAYQIIDKKENQIIAHGVSPKYAALLTSAPELLEALKVAKEELTFLHVQDTNGKHWSQHSETAIFKINATIAKAEGRK